MTFVWTLHRFFLLIGTFPFGEEYQFSKTRVFLTAVHFIFLVACIVKFLMESIFSPVTYSRYWNRNQMEVWYVMSIMIYVIPTIRNAVCIFSLVSKVRFLREVNDDKNSLLQLFNNSALNFQFIKHLSRPYIGVVSIWAIAILRDIIVMYVEGLFTRFELLCLYSSNYVFFISFLGQVMNFVKCCGVVDNLPLSQRSYVNDVRQFASSMSICERALEGYNLQTFLTLSWVFWSSLYVSYASCTYLQLYDQLLNATGNVTYTYIILLAIFFAAISIFAPAVALIKMCTIAKNKVSFRLI